MQILGWVLRFCISHISQVLTGTWILLEHGLFFEYLRPTFLLWLLDQPYIWQWLDSGDLILVLSLHLLAVSAWTSCFFQASTFSSAPAFLTISSLQARVGSTLPTGAFLGEAPKIMNTLSWVELGKAEWPFAPLSYRRTWYACYCYLTGSHCCLPDIFLFLSAMCLPIEENTGGAQRPRSTKLCVWEGL